MTTGIVLAASAATAADEIQWTVYSPVDKAKMNLTLKKDASIGELASALKQYCGAQGDIGKALIAGRRGVSLSTPAAELNQAKAAPGVFKLGRKSARGQAASSGGFTFIKLDGLKNADPETRAAGGYVKIGDIKGESTAAGGAFIKLQDFDGESEANAGEVIPKIDGVEASPTTAGEVIPKVEIESTGAQAGEVIPKVEGAQVRGKVFPKVEFADPYKLSGRSSEYTWKIVSAPSDQCQVERLYLKEKK